MDDITKARRKREAKDLVQPKHMDQRGGSFSNRLDTPLADAINALHDGIWRRLFCTYRIVDAFGRPIPKDDQTAE